jgi:flagellar hook-basal body complex protein FliE
LFASEVRRGGARKRSKPGFFAPCGAGRRLYIEIPMKLDLKPFDFNQAVARAGLRPDGTPLTGRAGNGSSGVGAIGGDGDGPRGNFRTAMADALQKVSADQLETERLQREFSLDNPTVSLEQTMVAMQKSQIGFQAVVQVKIGRAHV